MDEAMNLTGLKTLNIVYIQREDLLKNLDWLMLKWPRKNKEVCSGQEVSTHVLEVSTYEDSKQFDIEVSTHWVEEWTVSKLELKCRHMKIVSK